MKTKYIIEVKTGGDQIIDELFGGRSYIWRYRSNYDYVETCFKRTEAKTYATKTAAENAARNIINKYKQFKGYEILEIKKKI